MPIDIHGIPRKAAVGERALFDDVIEAVPALVCILDTEGRIVRFNPACVELTGRSEEEMRGQPVWAELIPQEQRSAVEEVFRSLHTSQIPSRFRNDWVDREGNRHPVEWSNSVVRDEAGATAFVIGTGTDLTRQARNVIPDPTLPPSVEADPDRLTQVLENLIANALKFTPAGGRVDVRAFANPGDEVVFEVRDTGRGIEPDHLPHLFERYWQSAPSSRRSVGLGLSIARGIVEAHGGRIWAESEPGRGAKLSFAIPSLAIQSVPATFWVSD